jgi:ATP phosphoribosyltransferase
MDKEWLTIALAKGRILPPTLQLFTAAGIDCAELSADTRKLVFTVGAQKLRFILGKPADIPTYVEYGAADLGVVGKDILLEQEKELYELLDLKIGACRLVVARRRGSGAFTGGYVATKYPRITERYFQQQGKQFELIKLHGSIDLAPVLNLADVIVDLVSTGKTLAENHLEEVETITPITSRLIANPGSYQVKGERVMAFTRKLERVLSVQEEVQ